MKICVSCGLEKEEKYFYTKTNRQIPGLSRVCKKCEIGHRDTRICKHCKNVYSNNRTEFCSVLCRILDRTKVLDNGCWEARFRKFKKDVRISIKEKSFLIRDVMYKIYYKKVPINMKVTNICNNMTCINPEHLSLELRRNPGKEIFFTVDSEIYNSIKRESKKLGLSMSAYVNYILLKELNIE